MKCIKCDVEIKLHDPYNLDLGMCETCYDMTQVKSNRMITDDELYYKFGFEL